MDIYCRVTPHGLVPLYDSDLEERKRLKVGSTVRVRVSLPRNYKFLKKFFALVRLTFDNLPTYIAERLNVHNEEDMLKCLKQDLGLFRTTTINGREAIEYGSISFASMDNAEFERFYNCCIDLILYKYLRGTDRDDLINEIHNFM